MNRLLLQVDDALWSRRLLLYWGFSVVCLVCLYFTIKVSYLLFHSLAELFSIVIASTLFLIAWNAKRYLENPYLLFIGIAYFFIAFIDLLHTLSYKGMPIFTGYDYYANQLWIGARYMESLTLLCAFYFLEKRRHVMPYLTFGLYTFITVALVATIFWFRIFPICFIEGQGLTPFKKYSEYLICFLLVLSALMLVKNRQRFDKHIFHLLFFSLICTIISELAFTFYVSNYGFSNLVGHYFKIISFFLVYKAIVSTGIQQPYSLIFLELEQSNMRLQEEIGVRKKTEADLKGALEDVKTLSGIIPICAHCKQIRDDSGYWQQVEEFIHKHSDARFSHGICPACYEKELEKIVSARKKNT